MKLLVFNEQKSCSAVLDSLNPILLNQHVRQMRLFIQHGDTSCYSHSLRVARYTYKVCKLLGLDSQSAVRGAMLHDFFLYNWRDRDMSAHQHLISHPHAALEMASREFDLNDMEKDIIKTHMWPVTSQPPSYWESHIVSLMDKVSATVEAVEYSWRTVKWARSKYYNYVRHCVRRMPIKSGLY